MKSYLPLILFFWIIASPLRAGEPESLSATTIAEMNKPGVVMVQATHKAYVTIPGFKLDLFQGTLLDIRINRLIETGELPNDQNAIISYKYREIFNDPLKFLKPVSQKLVENKELAVSGIGTGFVITPEGYVVTNAHVVKGDSLELKKQFALTAIGEVIEQDLKDMEISFGIVLNEEMKALHQQASLLVYATYMDISEVTSTYVAAFGETVPGEDARQYGLDARVIKAGEALTGRDLALLKIEGNNFPTVRIGEVSSARTGAEVYVMGYPDAPTFSPFVSEKSQLTPTFTKGIVSARKEMKDGRDVLQIDAPATHGNSGGPVFNDRGEVVGILTFGSISTVTQQEVQGMNFALSVDNLTEFLGAVNPEMNPASDTYRSALLDFEKEWYSAALEKFESVQTSTSKYPYLAGYVADCQELIEAGKDKTPGNSKWIFIGLGVVVVLVGGGLLLRKKKG